jgi:tetratricopeptide (TPR) repeat protein
MIRRTVFLLFAASVLCLTSALQADDSKVTTPNAEALAAVRAADQLKAEGKFQDAVVKYQDALKIDKTLEPAQTGLAVALLRAGKPDAALDAAVAAFSAHPDSAPVLAVLGRVQFRRGDMAEAEQAYQATLQIDSKNIDAYLGLTRLYRAYSLYARAYMALKRAHDLDPKNSDVQLLWLQTLPRRDRLAALQAYMSGPHQPSSSLQHYETYLEKTHDEPLHGCKVAGNVDQTEIKLDYVHDPYPHIEGLGMELKVNDRSHVLLLDTGASGILISRKAANKAGLRHITDIAVGGIGDEGDHSGYLALADKIKVGNLEFHDCIVTVTDRASLADSDADGLLGADVFASYLVDIDLPHKMMRLSPLPKRPGDEEAVAKLNSQDQSDEPAVDAESADITPGETYHPKDRYVAPDMKSWTPVFRFGHMLLVPTQLNASKPVLFLLDTGAFQNTLSTRAARATAKVDASSLGVEGESGRVADVYRAEKVDIQFAHFHQPNTNAVTFDLSNISNSVGMEISGTLGFNLLSMLDIRIDYRDGLVDFAYRDNHGVAH